MKIIGVSLLFLIMISSIHCAINCDEVDPLDRNNLNFTHWDNVMNKYVFKGNKQGIDLNLVNYTGVNKDIDFLSFKCQVQKANIDGNWTLTQWNAFWINVYNFLAIDIIIENPCKEGLFGKCGPIDSIRNIGEIQPSPLVNVVWDYKFFNISNTLYSLNMVEHERLRAQKYNNANVIDWDFDQRIHACIVCASISCPNIRNEAYTVERLDEQMTNNTKEFLANPKKGSKVFDERRIQISQIFQFFPSDFKGNNSLGKFLQKYAPADVAKIAKEHEEEIDNANPSNVAYFLYNWDLNGDVSDVCDVQQGFCVSWFVIGPVIGFFGLMIILIIVFVACANKKNGTYQNIN